MTDDEYRSLMSHCVAVTLPNGNQINVRAHDALCGALKVLLDGGAKLRDWLTEAAERPWEEAKDTLCTDGQPYTRERHEQMCQRMREQLAARGPLTYELAMSQLEPQRQAMIARGARPLP